MVLAKGIPADMGAWAFIIGTLIAIVNGFVPNLLFGVALFLAALVVALVNITGKEGQTFLFVIIGLGVLGLVGFTQASAIIPMVGETIAVIIGSVGGFLIVVAGAYLFLTAVRILMDK